MAFLTEDSFYIQGALYEKGESKGSVKDFTVKDFKGLISTDKPLGPVAMKAWLMETPLVRFSTGGTLRKASKEAILEKLGMTSSERDMEVVPEGIRSIRQLPQDFPELAGFGAAPVGSVNPVGASGAVSTDSVGGFLSNILTTLTGGYVAVKTSKEQAEIAKAQSEITKAQIALKGLSQPISTSIGGSSMLPILLVLAAGAGVMFFVFRNKPQFKQLMGSKARR